MPTTAPGGVHQRPSGVTGVDRRVGLDRVDHRIVLTTIALQAHWPVHRADNAAGHRASKAKWRADRDDRVARLQRR